MYVFGKGQENPDFSPPACPFDFRIFQLTYPAGPEYVRLVRNYLEICTQNPIIQRLTNNLRWWGPLNLIHSPTCVSIWILRTNT